MAISYQQTDTTSDDGSAPNTSCATGVIGYLCENTDHYNAVEGGTAGTAKGPETASASNTGVIVHWKIAPPVGTTIPAGNWVVRHNVSLANMNLTWDTCVICKWTGASYTSLGSSSPAISFGSTGVKSTTISGSASAALTTGQYLLVVLQGTNGAMSNQQYTYVRDQLIDTPLVAPVSFVPRNSGVNHQNPGVLMEGRGWERRNWLWLPRRPKLWCPGLATAYE